MSPAGRPYSAVRRPWYIVQPPTRHADQLALIQRYLRGSRLREIKSGRRGAIRLMLFDVSLESSRTFNHAVDHYLAIRPG